MTLTATRTATELGFEIGDVLQIIASLERTNFVKSMTSFGDHRQWQDVYKVRGKGMALYIKFTDHIVTEFIVLSFKEK